MTTHKAKRRREQIIAAARTLFMNRPYEAVSIGDLEKATGLTRGPIYYYFKGKEEIYAAIVVDELRLIARGIADMAARCGDMPEFIGALVAQQDAIYRNDKALFDIHFRFFFGRQNAVNFPPSRLKEVDAIISDVIGTIAGKIEEAIRTGQAACEDAHFAALAMWGMMVTTLQMGTDNERFRAIGRPRETLADDVQRQLLTMLRCSVP